MKPDLAPIINEIRGWHRERCFAMESRKIADLRLGAELRTRLGWSRDLPKAESDEIKKRAKGLMKLGEKIIKEDARIAKLIARGKPAKRKTIGLTDAEYAKSGEIIIASIHGRKLWDEIEGNAEKEMERLAAFLPVAEWFKANVFKGSFVSLAVIAGEAGDLSNYPKKGHLWKRMGLAVIDGVRQGGLRKTASAEDWIAHGYNRKRRSQMFVIGDSLVKGKSAYRKVYLERKAIEKAKAKAAGLTVCPAAKIPAKRKNEFVSDGHIHRRAQRYLEKRLLKDLWQAWRRAELYMPEMANPTLPAAEIEREAARLLPAKAIKTVLTSQPLKTAKRKKAVA